MIGPQPEVKPLPPVESLNRFNDLFNRFLCCLASEENPLTLFIDDLQWCDTASLDFLTNVFANYKDHPYLFFLGAYRSNEVDSAHPFIKLIESMQKQKLPLKEIRLEALKPEHTHEIISYMLDYPLINTKALADFISLLSEGNPLFISESLSYLHNEDLLFLDENRQWRWDISKIHQCSMPKSIVALFSSKIKSMPPPLIDLLEYCACMGNIFSPVDLQGVRGMTLLETFELLKPALSQGMLIETKGGLRFVHDKVQEAVLSMIPAERRRSIHWQVGSYLLASIPEDCELEKLDNLFAIVSHLNLGRDETPDEKTAYFLSAINYHAGNKALGALATKAAREYYAVSRNLLPADCWDDDHYLCTFRIFQKSAKTELMCGSYEKSEKLLNYLLEHAKTDLDRAECLAEQTTSLSSIGNFIKAIETANKGLAYFGKSIPADPKEADRRCHELLTQIESKSIDVWETILNMPFTTDRESKIELAFYSELIPDLYMSGRVPQLYLSAAQSTEHCLAGGMDESVIYSFSIMGLLLGERGEFERAFKYEDLACALCAKYPDTFGATRGMNGVVWCNKHSRSHPQEIVEYCRKAIQCGKNCGDLYNAGLSYGPLMWNLQVQGADLYTLEDYAAECLQFSHKYHLSFSVGLAEAMQAGWINPMKSQQPPAAMEDKIRQWERDNHIASAGSYYVHMGIAQYYLGEYTEAATYLEGVKKYLSGLTDNVLKRQWHVFVVLNALKLYERGIRYTDKEELLAEIRPHIIKIEQWAALGPLLRPYLAFLYAELERVTGDIRKARNLYLDAVEVACEQQYTFLTGHLCECLGELLLQAGLCSGKMYFLEALRLYQKCYMKAKKKKLIEKHPEYFTEEDLYPPSGADLPDAILPKLDIEYLMKSSLAISAEIEQESLIKKIMNVVLESSGAQSGYLVMKEEEDLYIRAASSVTQKQVVEEVRIKLEEAEDICQAIVRYVYRTKEMVILNDACKEGVFKDLPEVRRLQLRSVLCLPVMKQSKLIGIMYLENRLADSVFTLEKMQMAVLLTSQAAVSLENARLLEEAKKARAALREANEVLESRVRERTAELERANMLLEKDVFERKMAEESVKAERQRFNDVLDRLPTYLLLMTPDHHIRFANRVFKEKYGDPGNKCCFELLFSRSEPCENCESFIPLKTGVRHEWEWYGPDDRHYLVFDYPFCDLDGTMLILEIGLDITDRINAEKEIKKLNIELEERVNERTAQLAAANQELKASETQLQTALHEKDILLKEIHHRVKNNLQIIHSMLNLQLPYIKDPQDMEFFKESKNRIYSMALIHEKLYKSESLASILPATSRVLPLTSFIPMG